MKTKKICKAASFLLCFIMLVITPSYSYAQEDSAYCVMDGSTLEVLEESNLHQRLEMASTTKVMTAIIVLENIPLDQTIKIDAKSCNVDGSSMYLKPNELYSVEDLLYGLMLASGNDAAVALANAVAGSCDSFVKLMNDKAAELNLKNTNYCNPHGLHNKNHYTSAYDLAILCSYAMQNDDFYKIVSNKSKIVTELNSNTSRTIYNKNKFINMLEGADGIKIGYTTDAGRCLCASATKEGRRLICVILNYHNWFNMAVNLLNKYF